MVLNQLITKRTARLRASKPHETGDAYYTKHQEALITAPREPRNNYQNKKTNELGNRQGVYSLQQQAKKRLT